MPFPRLTGCLVHPSPFRRVGALVISGQLHTSFSIFLHLLDKGSGKCSARTAGERKFSLLFDLGICR